LSFFLRATHTFLKAIAMPLRSGLQGSALPTGISCEIKRMDEKQFFYVAWCDEIVNSPVMLIAARKKLVFAVF